MDGDEISSILKKLQTNSATTEEKDRYMSYLHETERISDDQYKRYRKNKYDENVIRIAIIAGAAILLAILLDRKLEK